MGGWGEVANAGRCGHLPATNRVSAGLVSAGHNWLLCRFAASAHVLLHMSASVKHRGDTRPPPTRGPGAHAVWKWVRSASFYSCATRSVVISVSWVAYVHMRRLGGCLGAVRCGHRPATDFCFCASVHRSGPSRVVARPDFAEGWWGFWGRGKERCPHKWRKTGCRIKVRHDDLCVLAVLGVPHSAFRLNPLPARPF